MFVYVVTITYVDYELMEKDVVGVFSSVEKAQKCLDKIEEFYNHVTDEEMSGVGEIRYEIIEFEFDGVVDTKEDVFNKYERRSGWRTR